MLRQDPCSQLIVPLGRLVCDLLKSSKTEELGVEAYVCHASTTLLRRYAGVAALNCMEIGLIMRRGVIELIALDPDRDGSFCPLLVKFLEESMRNIALLLVESLHRRLNLLN